MSVRANNVLRYADIAFGGGGSFGQLWVGGGAGVTLDHITFASAGNGCDLDAQEGADVVRVESRPVGCAN